MRRLKLFFSSSLLLLLPMITMAAGPSGNGLANNGTGGGVGKLLENIITFSTNVLIPFIIGIGFLVFVWGMFQYFIAGGANDDSKDKGKSLMIYATVGFLLIIVFWGIVNLLAGFTGLDNADLNFEVNVPQIDRTQ